MKFELTGFSYYIDENKEKDFESFEKKMNKLDVKEVIANTKKMEIHVYTTKL